MKDRLIIITPEELETLVCDIINKTLIKQTQSDSKLKFYTKKQVMQTLKIGYAKLQTLIESGTLKATESGKISEYEINKYLENDRGN